MLDQSRQAVRGRRVAFAPAFLGASVVNALAITASVRDAFLAVYKKTTQTQKKTKHKKQKRKEKSTKKKKNEKDECVKIKTKKKTKTNLIEVKCKSIDGRAPLGKQITPQRASVTERRDIHSIPILVGCMRLTHGIRRTPVLPPFVRSRRVGAVEGLG